MRSRKLEEDLTKDFAVELTVLWAIASPRLSLLHSAVGLPSHSGSSKRSPTASISAGISNFTLHSAKGKIAQVATKSGMLFGRSALGTPRRAQMRISWLKPRFSRASG